MEIWKKTLLRAAGFGAGFTVVSALIVAVFSWWTSRPPKVKPWDDKAIVALYESLDTEGDENTYRFVYTLENTTDTDYRVENDSNIHLAAFLKRSQALSFSDSKDLRIDYPIYVPAKSRVRFTVHLGYPYPIKPNPGAGDDEQHDFNTKVAQYVTKELGNVDGFTLLDENSRYKIVMPNGWAERAKMPMKVQAISTPKPQSPANPPVQVKDQPSEKAALPPDKGDIFDRVAACQRGERLANACKAKHFTVGKDNFAHYGGWQTPLPSLPLPPASYELDPSQADCGTAYQWQNFCRAKVK